MKRIKSCFGNTNTMVSLLGGHVLKGDVRGKKRLNDNETGIGQN
jgi:translation initiation factor IF-1